MRNKIITSIAALLLLASSLFAIEAPKTPYQYKQPDGTVVTLVNHGDEFHSWVTMGNTVVVLGEDGFWHPAPDQIAAKRPSEESKRMRRAAREMALSTRSSISIGEKPFLVVLVEFSDLSFTIANPNDAFYNLLNQEGYSANGGTGSSRDFYIQSSGGRFKPTFEVKGPVKLSKSYAYYGLQQGSTHDVNVREGFAEAIRLLDSQVDYSRYDNDGDGNVDNVFFYYAGHNQAEGGGENTIWPHAWNLTGTNYYDGVRISRYACTSEYRGSSGNSMCGIGTFTHEFGHVLGLPDFYDTDYEENGTALHMKTFSTMASGAYNNNGRTPPFFNALERNMLGWMDGYSHFTKGNVTIQPIQDNVGYITETGNSGEFFVYECRNGSSWDAFLPTGLMIYHVDQSNNVISGSVTAKSVWNANDVNAYSSHPCCYLVASSNYNSNNYIMFPGSGNVKQFTPKAWSGELLPYTFNNITYTGSAVTLTVDTDQTVRITGKVFDLEGNPMEGVNILAEPSSASIVQKSLTGKVRENAVKPKDASYSVKTASDGSYTIVLADGDNTKKFDVSASANGYITKTLTVQLEGLVTNCDFYIRKVGEIEEFTLRKYNPDDSFTSLGYGSAPCSIMGAVSYSAAEAARYVGMKLTDISFQVNATSCSHLYVVVDFGSERVLSREIINPNFDDAIRVDVSDADLTIPSGKDIYIGYGVQNADNAYPLIISTTAKEGGMYYASYNLNTVSWTAYDGALLLSAKVVGDTDPGTGEITLAQLGYSTISDPGFGSYTAGSEFKLALDQSLTKKPASVAWTFDGSATTKESVTLSAGKHTVVALLSYQDGSTEEITLEITAQ
ncbi:MAG: M6 family metalloprotease domain-containing protein [Bacteroidales bacterium]|nr:M6 family metalloprotease domain-containing protein [Bacteroidales bacterium]